jgi:hypothetical protein
MWCDLGLMKKLGEKYDMPIWFYYQGLNHHNVDFFIFPMVRSMMYAGVLYGVKGLQHFSTCGSIITENGDKDIFFEEQKAIHAEFDNLGKTLMALTCKRVIHDSTVNPECEDYARLHNIEKDSEFLTESLPKRISVSESEDEHGNKYMMILNRDYMTEKKISLPLNGQYRIYEVSKTDGNQKVIFDSTSLISLTLAPGDAVLYRIQNASDEPFTIEYKLS